LDFDCSIYVAGGESLLGSALLRRLRDVGYQRVWGDAGDAPDLHCRQSVEQFFAERQPQYVFHAAGRSGGILANQTIPADLCRDNLTVTLNLLDAAHRHDVRRLLYLSSACCYPRQAPQPLRVESLWSGPLEPTNHAYAAARLAGGALCRAYREQFGCDFVVGIPTNSFGPSDNFDPQDAHVVSSLMARMHAARLADEPRVAVWGSGQPVREFLYVDDLADACLHVMRLEQPPPTINLAGGANLSIAELAERIQHVVGFRGRVDFDTSRPDGMPRKSLDAGPLLASGWRPRIDIDRGLLNTYEWFSDNIATPSLAHVA
jgi:GDP-L-fucose synthase